MIDNLEPKPNMWEANPRLKMLSLVFIFVFLFSGIGLVILSQVQNNYRQKIYQETVDSLPKHEDRVLENQEIGISDVANWKIYKNDQYGFELKYPNDFEVSKNIVTPIIPLESKYGLVDFREVDGNYPVDGRDGRLIDAVKGERAIELLPIGNLSGGFSYEVLINRSNPDRLFIVTFEANELADTSKYEEFRKILSTFKFIK